MFLLFAKVLVFFFAKKPSLAVWAVAPLDVGEQYIKAAFTMQFLEVQREWSQGQTWLDAFFVQSRNRIRKKFNLKVFTYYLRLQKSLLYIFPIEFLSNFTIFESSTRCLKVWPDWIPFLCKIIMEFVENSIWKLLFIFQGFRKSLQVL